MFVMHASDDDYLCVEIVSYGEAFEPYQSHFARELSDEFRICEKARKRLWDLRNWKWDEVIDLDGDEENPIFDVDLLDTADSASAFSSRVKIPRVVVHRRGSVHHVRDTCV